MISNLAKLAAGLSLLSLGTAAPASTPTAVTELVGHHVISVPSVTALPDWSAPVEKRDETTPVTELVGHHVIGVPAVTELPTWEAPVTVGKREENLMCGDVLCSEHVPVEWRVKSVEKRCGTVGNAECVKDMPALPIPSVEKRCGTVGNAECVKDMPALPIPTVEKRCGTVGNAECVKDMPELPIPENATTLLSKRSFSCSTLVTGLNALDCAHMSSIGMYSQGKNAVSNNGVIWLGSDGPNKFTFRNLAGGVPITVIVWNNPAGDYSSSFMNVRQPYISYSLADQATITVSLANGVSGGFAALHNRVTTLSQYGQIYNTWGEFTTGAYATVDVSREVNMGGNGMSINLDSGCISNMAKCVFTCKSGNTCGASGTYDLVNCAAGSQTGASYGLYSGNPSGGCTGFANGGHLEATFYNS